MRRERVTGAVVIVLGVVVAVVAVLALREPDGHHSAAPRTESTTSTRTSTATGSPAPTRRPSSSTPRTSASSGPGSSTPAGSSTPTGSTAGTKTIPLVVLNNTTTSGLAADAAKRFESGGWTVTTSGNLTNNIISTCAYYDPDVAGAKAAAEALRVQYPTIKRVEAKFAELPAGPIVVVLTPDYSPS